MRQITLVYPVKVPQIFLAVNLEGENQGLYGGFEGDYHRDDVVEGLPAALRIFGEICCNGDEAKDEPVLERVAIVNYYRGDVRDAICHAFFAKNWRGELRASAKTGEPVSFKYWDLPLKQMSRKEGDWLKRTVEGERAIWSVYCNENNQFEGCLRERELVPKVRRPSP